MDIQKQREAFESAYIEFRKDCPLAKSDLLLISNGSYLVNRVNDAWIMWQQAQKMAVAEWNNYETKSPRIDGRYLIFVGGEKLCADFSVGFGFSSAEDGTAFIQELITHWVVPCDDPIEAQEQVE